MGDYLDFFVMTHRLNGGSDNVSAIAGQAIWWLQIGIHLPSTRNGTVRA